MERGQHAAHALGAFGAEIGLVGGLDAQRIDETVGEIVGDVDMLRIDLRPVAVDDLHVAGGYHAPGVAVILYPLGDQLVAAVIDLDAAHGDDGLVIVVIDQGVGFQKHLGTGRRLRFEIRDALRTGWLEREAAHEERKGAHAAQQRCPDRPTVL